MAETGARAPRVPPSLPAPPPVAGEGEPLGFARRAADLGQRGFDRLYSFRVTYVAIFVFILLYVFSVKGAEHLLETHFKAVVAEAVLITNLGVPVTMQIQSRIDRRVKQSPWVRIGGVQATVIVLASDGRTWLYVGGRTVQPPASLDPWDIVREAERLLPANDEVIVAVPHNALVANAILVFYATLLLTGLFFYNRAVARREARAMGEAVAGRDAAARRAESIESELEAVREQMLSMEPADRERTDEIRALQAERESLQGKLAILARREEDLRLKADRAVELDQERQALEDLLEEASGDMTAKDQEIRQLEKSLKRASKESEAGKSARTRDSDALARRLDTLYKTLEIEPRALSDMIALRDETMKLKAEESLKRLADETENVGVRRKVGGLPPHLSIFELGFAGKGRIYYMRGERRRFRILTIGAKNTQKTDLDYLRKLNP